MIILKVLSKPSRLVTCLMLGAFVVYGYGVHIKGTPASALSKGKIGCETILMSFIAFIIKEK